MMPLPHPTNVLRHGFNYQHHLRSGVLLQNCDKILLVKIFHQRSALCNDKLVNPRSDLNVFGRHKILEEVVIAKWVDVDLFTN